MRKGNGPLDETVRSPLRFSGPGVKLLESAQAMKFGQHMIAAIEKKKRPFSIWHWYVPLAIVGVSVVFVFYSVARAPKQIEETVTIDASRHVVTPSGTPVANAGTLPIQERDIEIAGDRIAEAIIYLKKKQSAAAIHALHQAQAATNHALAARGTNGGENNDLVITANDLLAIERAIQRGALDDAARQLNALDNRLDALEH